MQRASQASSKIESLMRYINIFAVLFIAFLPRFAIAQSSNEILGSIDAVTAWFSKLNTQFDAAIKKEVKAQLQRSVDGLRKNLYALEIDASILIENVPDQAPNAEQRFRLDQLAQELQTTVQHLTKSARAVGADLRLNEAERVEAALTSGLQTRATILQEFRLSLLPPNTANWNGPEIRARLSDGVAAIKKAQLAVTEFSRRLSSTP
jgi:hypothetical protein